jgi:septal ring-binding cell division protein DamX
MLYIVVCGVFHDRTAAKTASARLSASAVSPWIRRIAGVHAEIETTDQRLP